jgi:hypothetical protein
MRRSDKFTLNASMPQAAKAGWVAFRDWLRQVRAEQAPAQEAHRKITADRDLNNEARARKQREVRANLEASLGAAFAGVQQAIGHSQRALAELVDRSVMGDPLSALVESVPVESRAARAQLELLAGIQRRLARRELYEDLDRVVAAEKAGDGAALNRFLDRAAADPLMASLLATEARPRLVTEGRTALVAVLDVFLEGTREARLDENGKLAADHVDALGAAFRLAEAVWADVRSEGFLDGKAPALKVTELEYHELLD